MDTILTQGADGAGDTAGQGAGGEGSNAQQGGNQDQGQQGGDGGGNPSFFDSLPEDIRNALPEELRSAQALEGRPELAGILKKHLEMDKALKDAPKPPETADGYEVPTGEGLEVNPEYLTSFKAVAHEAGLSQAQVEKLATWQNGFLKAAIEKQQADEQEAKAKANETAQQMLQKPEKEGGWGAKFDEKLDRAKRAFNSLAGSDPQLVEWARDPRIGSSPQFLRLLSIAADKMSEDSLAGTHGGGAASAERMPDGRPMLKFSSMDK